MLRVNRILTATLAGLFLSGVSAARADLREDLLKLTRANDAPDVRSAMSAYPGSSLAAATAENLCFAGDAFAGHPVTRWNFDLPVRGSAAFVSIRFDFPEGKDEHGTWRSDIAHGDIHRQLVETFGPADESADGKHRDSIWNLGDKGALDPPLMILTYAWLGHDRRIELTCLRAASRTPPAAPANSGPFPDPSTLQGAGTNPHFLRGHTRDLDRMADAGLRWIRTDFSWAETECVKGEYDWSAHDELTANLAARGMRPIYVLAYGNALYEPPPPEKPDRFIPPTHPESVAAYARWAGSAARHFAGKHVVWEVWNEPNGGWFWKPGPDADRYAELLLTTCQSIRQADPGATIIAPAAHKLPWDFLFTVFDSGALAQIDAVSVHPYRSEAPETAAGDYTRLRALIASCAPPGRKGLPILDGEWGYSTQRRGVSRETQADYLTRMLLFDRMYQLPITIWYDWIDDGPDPSDGEQNFGMLAHDNQWKPAYEAVRSLLRELAGYRLVSRESTTSAADYILRFDPVGPGRPKMVAWTTDSPHEATIATATVPHLSLDLASRPRCWVVP